MATTVPVTMFAVMVLVVRHAVSSLRRELLESVRLSLLDHTPTRPGCLRAELLRAG